MSCVLQPDFMCVTEEMEVPYHLHGFIIGQKGKAICSMMEKFDVKIIIPPQKDQSSSISIKGTPANVALTKGALRKKIEQLELGKQDRNLETPKIQLKMSVDPQHYARIIGRGGVVIKKIRDDYNVSINFPERDSNERTITITGCEKDAEAAKECIMDLFVKQRRSDLFHLINKYQKELERENFLKEIESKDPDWYREIHDFLIKLTSQKIDKIRNLQIGTGEKLNMLVNLTYESAVYESDRTTLYAAVCKKLALVKVPLAGQPGQYVNIEELLVEKCLKEFEQGICYELEYEDFLKTIESTDAIYS